jgi:uncharacterized metal-binding protein YceD (DUF177 family)
MQFNVSQLLQEPIGTTRSYDLVDDLTDLDPELNTLGPLVGSVQLMRTNSGVLATGNLSTAIQVSCSRCLAPIVLPIRFQIEESFYPLTDVQTGRYINPKDFEGSADSLEDEALLIDEHHILDIFEVVRQDIWLALPMVPGCNWEGAGECPNLTEHMREAEGLAPDGNNDNVDGNETIDPRWSALLQLRDQQEAED